MKNKIKAMKGFTLVELLIVIALIAILSVAVLATINPVEQANKARDSRVQNDAAEVLNAYERYYANIQRYPWEDFADDVSTDDMVFYSSVQYGFGICSDEATNANVLLNNSTTSSTVCDDRTTGANLLISTSELKSSFGGKDEFTGPIDGDVELGLWVAKETGASSIYTCYIPKANANRIDATKMRCVNSASGAVTKSGEGACVAAVADWATPTFDGTVPMFRCVPE